MNIVNPRSIHPFLAVLTFMGIGASPAACQAAAPSGSLSELADVRRWAASKFEGVSAPVATEPALLVLANHGPVQKNARGGRPMHIVDKEYTRGLYCHAPEQDHRPSARARREVHRHRGRGQQRQHQRRARQRGLLGQSRRGGEVPLRRDARGHARQAGPGGAGGGEGVCACRSRKRPDGISCDQADWVEAKITLKDGSELWLADLPLREGERAPYTTEPPFSFVYGGKASADLLKEWPCQRTARKLDEQRTERTSVWTDPATGLQVRCVGIEYGDFPTVEWVVHFKNTGAEDTPILSDIQGVDLGLARSRPGRVRPEPSCGR